LDDLPATVGLAAGPAVGLFDPTADRDRLLVFAAIPTRGVALALTNRSDCLEVAGFGIVSADLCAERNRSRPLCGGMSTTFVGHIQMRPDFRAEKQAKESAGRDRCDLTVSLAILAA